MRKQVAVVGAVIERDGLILCARRGGSGPLAGMWEFPGGKIEPGESPLEALEREVREELRCEIRVGDEVTTTVHEYDFAIVTLTTFRCRLMDGTPQLTEHRAIEWLPAVDLGTLAWAPADVPAVQILAAT